MTNNQADTLERIEKFGISRTAWRLIVMAAFAMLAFLGAFLSLTKGSADISLAQIINILSNPTLEPQSQIIWNIRMPRTIVGALVGVNLAIAGAVLQAVMRNPLADPHIIGISSGAGLAGVTIMILFPTLEYLITPAAFIGAMLAAVCIYILAWKNGIKPVRIILAGVAVSAFLSAGISGLMIFYSDRVHGALMWMVGGLAARSWPHVSIILPYAIAGVLLAFIGAAYLNILQLGDEMARGLGVNVEVTRIAMTAVAALLAASAVSVVGLLGFVGLIVPHAARLIIGSDYRYLMPASGLLGIAVVTLSDTFARVVYLFCFEYCMDRVLPEYRISTESDAFHAAERNHPDEHMFPRSSSFVGRKGAMAGCPVCRTDHLYRTDDRLPIPAQDMQSGGIRLLSFGIPHHPLYRIVHLSDGLQTECHAMQIAFDDGKTDGTFTFCIRNVFAFTENFHSDKPFTFFAGLT